MTSSAAFRFWLWDAANTTWQQVNRFEDFTWNYRLNFHPSFRMTAYVRDANIRSLLKAGTEFRITNRASDDGTVETGMLGLAFNETGAASGSREIFSGQLDEPTSDQQTQRTGDSEPIIWRLSGQGWSEQIRGVSNNTTDAQGPAKLGTIVQNYINSVDSNTTVTQGTIDQTGSGIDAKTLHRDDTLHAVVGDIATVGDDTNFSLGSETKQFIYYIHVDGTTDGHSNPRVHYLSPVNSIFSVGTAGDGRTITQGRAPSGQTRTRNVEITKEFDRIVNAVRIRYLGGGTGTKQAEYPSATTWEENSTSITNYGRNEEVIYAPWIQNSATAQTYAETIVDTFGGDSGGNGILRARATLRHPELFGTNSNFTGELGDIIQVNDQDGNEALEGILLGFEYEQMREATTAIIGLPRVPFVQDIRRTQRQVNWTTRQPTVTTLSQTGTTSTSLQNTENLVVGEPGASGSSTGEFDDAVSSTSDGTLTPVDDGGGANRWSFAFDTNVTSGAQHSWWFRLQLRLTSSSNVTDGPIRAEIKIRQEGVDPIDQGGIGGERVWERTFGPMFPGRLYRKEGTWIWGVDDSQFGSPAELDRADVLLTNLSEHEVVIDEGDDVGSATDSQVDVGFLPNHSVDLSHEHPW